MARSLLAMEKADEAREHFVRARDLDALRFRADTRINDIIREVADRLSSDVCFVDAERIFEEDAPDGTRLPGHETFFEHVHFRPEGNYRLARAVLEDDLASPAGVDPVAGGRESIAVVAGAVLRHSALTGWERYRMEADMAEMMGRPPFTNQADHEKEHARQREEIRALRARYGSREALSAAERTYAAARERWPDDLDLRQRYALFLMDSHEFARAAESWRPLVERFPATMRCA